MLIAIFQPSQKTKRAWLYARVPSFNSFSLKRPGLFGRVHIGLDLAGFIVTLVLELLATYYAHYEGVAITAILVMIFADIVIAIFAHLPMATIRYEANRQLYLLLKEIPRSRRRWSQARFRQRIGYFAILVSAALKIYWFMSIYQEFDTTSLFVMGCYLLAAVLHISCTGYLVFGLRFLFLWQREYSQHELSGGELFAVSEEQPLVVPILTSASLNESPAGPHRLVHNSNKATFQLEIAGLLYDEELNDLLARQYQPEQQDAIVRAGVKAQIDSI